MFKLPLMSGYSHVTRMYSVIWQFHQDIQMNHEHRYDLLPTKRKCPRNYVNKGNIFYHMMPILLHIIYLKSSIHLWMFNKGS